MSKREAGQLEKTLGNTMSEFKKFILKGNIIDMRVQQDRHLSGQ